MKNWCAYSVLTLSLVFFLGADRIARPILAQTATGSSSANIFDSPATGTVVANLDITLSEEEQGPVNPAEVRTLEDVRVLQGRGNIAFITELAYPPDPRKTAMKKLQKLKSELTSNEGDQQVAHEKLKQALNAYFIGDMQHRVRELDEIKERLAEMEKKLQKRLKSREEIVDLQMKLFLHEANGLGFFAPGDDILKSKTRWPGSVTYGSTNTTPLSLPKPVGVAR